MQTISIISAWSISRVKDKLYIPRVHSIYLDYVCEKYNNVFLIAPVVEKEEVDTKTSLIKYNNLSIVEMPYFGSYLGAQKYYFKYKKAVKQISKKVDLFYARVPDPFSWMPALLTDKPTIMHFVGDTIDATKHNQLFSPLKKKLMIAGYMPEYKKVLKAAKQSEKVLTNGIHISTKLKEKGINAKPIVSSTISKNDLTKEFKTLSKDPLSLTYVGYLRGAKGIDTIINVIKLMNKDNINFKFNIVGDGDMFDDLQNLIENNRLEEKVKLWGFVNDRNKLFEILDSSDIFFFPSLSEGSPRVVIEAMSRGVPVISTPVGSLPYCFEDGKEIMFFPINDTNKAYDQIMYYLSDPTKFDEIRKSAFDKVKHNYTSDIFFKHIFEL